MILVTTTVKKLSIEEAELLVPGGAAYVDLRRADDYLDAHVPCSVCLQYEFGPGMPGRARDCIPLDVPLVLLGSQGVDMAEVTASLRGKGFGVPGYVADGLKVWAERSGTAGSTPVVEETTAPDGTILSVGDPGSPLVQGATFIPLERLWYRVDEIPQGRVVIAAGRSVRAAMAVGMLERSGRSEITVWRYVGR